jgi:putative tricarboxylic transport membrane protein
MRKPGELVVGLSFLVIGLIFAGGSVKLSIGTPTEPLPGFFPFLGGLALIVLSLVFLGLAWRGRTGQSQPFGRLSGPVILVVALILYVAVLETIGFVIATVFLSAVILKVLGANTGILILVSLALPAASYFIFDRLLGVTLPAGILAALF